MLVCGCYCFYGCAAVAVSEIMLHHIKLQWHSRISVNVMACMHCKTLKVDKQCDYKFVNLVCFKTSADSLQSLLSMWRWISSRLVSFRRFCVYLLHCRITRLATFPDFLFLHMQKFTVGSDWVERKLGWYCVRNIYGIKYYFQLLFVVCEYLVSL